MTTWFPFQGFGCPVSGCTGQKGSYNWSCDVCGTQMFISQTGYLKCANGFHVDHISNWRFDCGFHGNHPARRYQLGDYQGFSTAMSHALGFMDNTGAVWIGALVMALGQQYGRM